jgi:lysophospholipase L1-like esterase
MFTVIVLIAVGSVIYRGRREDGEDAHRSRELWTLAHAMAPRGLEAPEMQGISTTLVREPLDATTAARFFPVGEETYDPHTYFHLRPNLDEMRAMPEYPGGAWRMKTNSLGLREDHDLAPRRTDVFIVVAGDSQAEGVCSNDMSFANRLEAMLAHDHPGKSVEVLNTGCAAYSFYNYLGALEAYVDKKPDVFVTAIFGGNDFMECLALFHHFHHTQTPPVDPKEWAHVAAMLDAGEAAQAQWLASAGYFSRFPDQVDCALRAALEVVDEMKRQCAAMGTALIFVYIPSVYDLNDGEGAEQIAKVKEILKLGGQDMSAGNRLGNRLVWALRDRGLDVIDLRDELDAKDRPWYWKDYHINVKAHERIAALLLPRVEAMLPSR